MLAVLRREGAEERRLETIDHVMGCGACRPEFDLLRAIEQAGSAERGGVALAHVFAGRRWRSMAPLALAASVAVVVAVGLSLRPREAPEIERGTGSAVAVLAPPRDIVAGGQVTFAWKAVPAAREYQLEVLDERGAVVFATRTAETSATLPDRVRLTPGASYRWWVRAMLGSGEPLSSDVRDLRIHDK
jgi:hypothetical protein